MWTSDHQPSPCMQGVVVCSASVPLLWPSPSFTGLYYTGRVYSIQDATRPMKWHWMNLWGILIFMFTSHVRATAALTPLPTAYSTYSLKFKCLLMCTPRYFALSLGLIMQPAMVIVLFWSIAKSEHLVWWTSWYLVISNDSTTGESDW